MDNKYKWIKRSPYYLYRYNTWKTKEETVFYSNKYKTTITVPAGFTCDLATTPKFVHFLFPKDDWKYAHAAIVHDFLCRKKNPASYRMADRIFNEALKASNLSIFRRIPMYLYVRIWHIIKGEKESNT